MRFSFVSSQLVGSLLRIIPAGALPDYVIPAGAQRNAGISSPTFRAQSEGNFLTEDYLLETSNSD